MAVNDVKKGDTVHYSYYVYGVQCLADGVVLDVLENGDCVIDQGKKKVTVKKNDVLSLVSKAETVAPTKTEEQTVPKEDKVDNNRKFNHFGGK